MTDTRRSLEPDNEHVSHLLSPYLDGQVEEDERLQVERHLRTCSACRTELAQLRLIVGTMHAMPAMEPPRSFVLTPEMVQRRSWLSLWSTYSPAVAALAAVLLLALLFADVRLLQEPELALAPAVPEMVSQEAAAPAPEWDEANEPLAQPAAAAPLAPEATVAPAAVAPAQPADAPPRPAGRSKGRTHRCPPPPFPLTGAVSEALPSRAARRPGLNPAARARAWSPWSRKRAASPRATLSKPLRRTPPKAPPSPSRPNPRPNRR